jgi:UDP-glucose 4-epimerase
MTWLITGGAGYIGAHVAEVLIRQNYKLVIVDSLFNSNLERVHYLESIANPEQLEFHVLDIRDLVSMAEIFSEQKIEGVIHLAGLKSIEESVNNPELYNEVNNIGTLELFTLAGAFQVEKFMFSSTAAVYSNIKDGKGLKETALLSPQSPYGVSKLNAEKSIQLLSKKLEIETLIFRYFNVIGASCAEMKDLSTDNLVPRTIARINDGYPPEIFGNKYPSEDGTAVRDYIDVRDIASAHLRAIELAGNWPAVLNLGTGKGQSVLQVVKTIVELMGKEFEVEIKAPRLGDIPIAYADASLALEALDFSPHFNLIDSLKSITPGTK